MKTAPHNRCICYLVRIAAVAAFLAPILEASGGNTTNSTKPVRILFDSKGTQTQYNKSTRGKRLATILGALNSFGQNSTNTIGTNKTSTSYPPYIVSYTPARPITDRMLANQDIYISLTRQSGTNYQYATSELDALERFVKVGGKSILLHANHGPNTNYPSPPYTAYHDDYTINNRPLALRFGVDLFPYIVSKRGVMTMTVNTNAGSSTNNEMAFISNQAHTISAHDSCIIVPPTNYISIAKFPVDATVARHDGANTPLLPTALTNAPSDISAYTDFAILVHAGKGSVIVVGNSGMIADYGSPWPDWGLIPYQSNLMFFLNCVSYLTGDRNIPPPGDGPGYPSTKATFPTP